LRGVNSGRKCDEEALLASQKEIRGWDSGCTLRLLSFFFSQVTDFSAEGGKFWMHIVHFSFFFHLQLIASSLLTLRPPVITPASQEETPASQAQTPASQEETPAIQEKKEESSAIQEEIPARQAAILARREELSWWDPGWIGMDQDAHCAS